MSQYNDNNDFDNLSKLYNESSCKYTAKQDDEDIEEEEENTEEGTVDEGLLDDTKSFIGRQTARAGAVKDAVKGGYKAFRTGEGQGADKRYADSKTQRILQNHINRIDSVLSALVTDVVKLDIMDADEAERFATEVSATVREQFVSENKGRALRADKQNFDRMQPQSDA